MRSLYHKLRCYAEYLQRIEQGAGALILDEILQREDLRNIVINGTTVSVRGNSPDVQVAISSLSVKEYANIRLDKPKYIIDAGANIGTSSIYFAQKYPDARILAIEPEAENYELLKKNTAPYPNVTPIHAAIWSEAGSRTLQNRHTGPWGYTIVENCEHSEALPQDIQCLTIDSLMQKYQIDQIDLLKMDIEGGEKEVLENASAWIDAVQVMTVELHDRICMGCDRAFYLATQAFKTFEKHEEKVTAYRN